VLFAYAHSGGAIFITGVRDNQKKKEIMAFASLMAFLKAKT
jgi:hypothetical protein